ncbi:MerR family transcriptional regulator [Flavobacterium sp. ZT3R18]|uniref:chaperone modulator CbpM n=1 Tax=Flavobacterium sp. ZT3R18 TaxID=2594429 RepID=UPI00117B85A8|nr:chaperone modulator CbpM [Flavobacterium sp. ZT3R18]TRX31782.1 MerR family transcriptional regulator [Flavobacterium sp. ZT3R18]
MNTENLILLKNLCSNYQVELSFFTHLSEIGLIEIEIIEQSPYIRESQIKDIERMIRMHHELEVNPEGIDVVFNLLQKIDRLEKDLITAKNRLKLYES